MTEKEYSYRAGGFHCQIAPAIAGAELERIRQKFEGRLRPPDIVEESRDKAAPLHQAFEWRDKVAAEAHRLWQARSLVRSIQVISPETGEVCPAFFSIQMPEGATPPQRYYQSAAVIAGSPQEYDAAKRLLGRKVQEIGRAYDDLLKLAEKHESDPKRLSSAKRLERPLKTLRALTEAYV